MAEKEAQKIVQQAQLSDLPDRTKKVKDAKSEAQKEIDEYKQKKEEEFKKYESEQQSGNKKAEEDANKDAEVKLEEIKKAGDEKGQKVVDDLVNAVCTPHPEVPENMQRNDD
ncbi:hypothetical protein BT93_L0738 [Corymbia citriodora subsp. variegata]|uniref:V-type proton ATPase subunit G n=1 Tax=Corymbia citriodora subsp. variegata TaxID=360336 RepID=A0A8T0CEM8_CORYI|nr:hypothetical protein BT93_L0738 [Corymbia citriodora subsp. variegata]